jgi:RNA polymerase sigma factor (TIGR02999 family)
MRESAPITEMLDAWRRGEDQAEDRLLSAVYADLKQVVRRQLQRMNAPRRLDTTEYVNETYLELARQGRIDASNRGHFFGIVATIVRRLVVDHYRGLQSLKRGGDHERVPLEALDQVAAPTSESSEDYWLALDRALESLRAEDEDAARVVELRFYLGMTLEEVAEKLEVSLSTVNRSFRFARGWLQLHLRDFDPATA